VARFRRVVVVVRRTRLQALLERFVTEGQARFYLERMGLSYEEYARAHAAQQEALRRLRESMPHSPRHTVVERTLLPTFALEDRDLIITLGNNGLVANAAKYAGGRPILGINVDPAAEHGVVARFSLRQAVSALPDVLAGSFRATKVTMAEARLNDGQSLLAFNDLFIGQSGHASARYTIDAGGGAEEQSSSGIIVSTGAGSTGWLRSVYAGAAGVAASWDGGLLDGPDPVFPWDAKRLVFAVREPWPSASTGVRTVHGAIGGGGRLRVASKMPKDGVIFSDGVQEDAVAFNSGAVAEIAIARCAAQLVAG
jgi:hypothetical protein